MRAARFLLLTILASLGFALFGSASEHPDYSRFSNQELRARAERVFAMRNFRAAQRYYGELGLRLKRQLSELQSDGAQQQIEIEADLIVAPFGLGHSLIFLHRYPEALAALEEGLKVYPEWATSHVPLLFFQDPLFTGPVVSDLEALIRSSPAAELWAVHGYIQFFAENFRYASESFSAALNLNKDSFLADYFRQQIPLTQKRAAASKLEQFKSLDPESMPADELIDYGSSFFRNSDYSMAAELFKRAIDLDQRLPVVHIAYGDSLFALGRFDEATQAILKGLEIYPKYAESPINRREFYSNPSDFDKQLQHLENYVSSHPANLNARFLLGYNYFFIQAYDKADEQLQAVLSSAALHSPAQFLQTLIQKFSKAKDSL